MIDWCEKKKIEAKTELAILLAPTHIEFPVGRRGDIFFQFYFVLKVTNSQLQTPPTNHHHSVSGKPQPGCHVGVFQC